MTRVYFDNKKRERKGKRIKKLLECNNHAVDHVCGTNKKNISWCFQLYPRKGCLSVK